MKVEKTEKQKMLSGDISLGFGSVVHHLQITLKNLQLCTTILFIHLAFQGNLFFQWIPCCGKIVCTVAVFRGDTTLTLTMMILGPGINF